MNLSNELRNLQGFDGVVIWDPGFGFGGGGNLVFSSESEEEDFVPDAYVVSTRTRQAKDCQNPRWMFYMDSFEQVGLENKEVFMSLTGDNYDDCQRFSHGRNIEVGVAVSDDCEVQHGGIISMTMQDAKSYVFHYTSDFSDVIRLGSDDPSADDHGTIIARYSLFGEESNGEDAERLLWLSCDDEYIAAQIEAETFVPNELTVSALTQQASECVYPRWMYQNEDLANLGTSS